MGYDMHVVDSTGQRISKGMSYDEVCEQHLYWRRNALGGTWQAGKLVEAGLGYWPTDTDRSEDWPEPAEPYRWDESGNLLNPDPAYEAALLTYLRQTGDERPGISVYKLCSSNDGWWVTKAECESALKLWEQAGKPDVDDGLGDTIPFLEQAARHDGFRVW